MLPDPPRRASGGHKPGDLSVRRREGGIVVAVASSARRRVLSDGGVFVALVVFCWAIQTWLLARARTALLRVGLPSALSTARDSNTPGVRERESRSSARWALNRRSAPEPPSAWDVSGRYEIACVPDAPTSQSSSSLLLLPPPPLTPLARRRALIATTRSLLPLLPPSSKTLEKIGDMVVPSITPPTALSNDSANKTIDAKSDSSKARHRQQAAMMEAWLQLNSNNLYPTREQKDRLAADMQMTYMQVNRWFANRRRKQSKRRKTECTSPASSTTDTAADQRDSVSPPKKEPSDDNKAADFWAEAITAISRAGVIQPLDPNNNKDVSACETLGQQHQSAVHQAHQLQQVPDLQYNSMTAGGLASPVTPSGSSQQPIIDTSRLLDQTAPNGAAKLMATPPAYANHVNPFAANPFLPLGLGLYNQVTPGCWAAPGLVNPALAGLLPWLSAGYGLPPVTTPKMTSMSPAWSPPPVVASPMNGGLKDNASDTSLSDMSDLSPMPKHHGSSVCFLKESPACLLDGMALTEEESIAVSVLTELAMQRR
uniref:Homeobox domain-containing protein n=1 Tax=Plectus sambesii TaxID=2011161 RepID=A0A914VTP7_9BILA